MKRWRPGYSVAVLASLAVFSCENSSAPWGASPTVEDARSGLPPADVQLPPVPNLDIVDVPPLYEDGSYSIAGLLLNRDQVRGHEIALTGFLHSVYECESRVGDGDVEGSEVAAPPATAGSDEAEPEFERAGCLIPHVYLVDSLRARQRILVTGYDAAHYEPQLVPGRRYTVAGSYQQQTRGFISTEDGLVVASSLHGEGITPPEADAPPL